MTRPTPTLRMPFLPVLLLSFAIAVPLVGQQPKEPAKATKPAPKPPPAFLPKLMGLESGKPLPDLVMAGPDGTELLLSSLRGKPLVLSMAWSETVPKDKLQEIAKDYADYGVQVLSLAVFTPRKEYTAWLAKNQEGLLFRTAVDPVGKYEPGATPDSNAQMAFFKTTLVAKLFPGMYPAMPINMVLDGEGRFVGSFPLGPQWRDGLGNLLLHIGVELKPEHMPAVVAGPEAFVIKPPEPRIAEEPVAPIQVGAVAPDFETTDLGGHKKLLADYRGKVVVLDFWATWCGPCKAALPHVQQLAAKYKDQDVVVIASCTSDARGAFEEWLGQNQADYPDIVFTHDAAEKKPERASRRLYGVSGIPQQFVIDRTGKIAAEVSGYMAGEVLLDAALAKAGVKVDAAVLEQAAADQKKRDERNKR